MVSESVVARDGSETSGTITRGPTKATSDGQFRASPMAMRGADASGTTPDAVRQATDMVSTRKEYPWTKTEAATTGSSVPIPAPVDRMIRPSPGGSSIRVWQGIHDPSSGGGGPARAGSGGGSDRGGSIRAVRYGTRPLTRSSAPDRAVTAGSPSTSLVTGSFYTRTLAGPGRAARK